MVLCILVLPCRTSVRLCVSLGVHMCRVVPDNVYALTPQNGPDEPPVEIDFTPPWPRISMCSALEKKLGVTFPTDLASEEARQFFISLVSH